MLTCTRSETFWKWSTIIGCCLQMGTCGFVWFWGNLSVYTISYNWYQSHVKSNVIMTWIMPLALTGDSVGMLFAGKVIGVIGKRLTLLCGIIVQDCGFALVYFVVGKSMPLMNFCLGLVPSIGSGIVMVITKHIVIEWMSERAGLFIGITRASMLIGDILVNQFITLYLNPEDEAPDFEIYSMKMFTQKDVIERVPIVFLIIGGTYFGFQLLCLFMIREKSPVASGDTLPVVHVKNYSSLVSNGHSPKQKSQSDMDKSQQQMSARENIEISPCSPINSDNIDATPNEKALDKKGDDLTPRQALRTVEFYTLSITMALATVPFVAINNYGKLYGQLWIKSDHFLTSLGTVVLAFTVVYFLLCGLVMDKKGNRFSLILFFAILALVSLLFYFSPMIDKWLFCSMNIIYCCFASLGTGVYATCVARAFGTTHFSMNFAIVSVSYVPVNLMVPQMLEFIFKYMGWFYVYALASVASLISLVLVMVTIKK